MKLYLQALAMTQTMFCAIPLPLKTWNPRAQSRMPLFLPLIGLEIGLIWYLAAQLLSLAAVPALLEGLVLFAVPYLLTGFLHLDGFMDVTDAVRSCRDAEKRKEILKDSHVGAFAVIGCIMLFLSGLVLCTCLPEHTDLRILVWIPVISRCSSALAVTLLRPLSCSEYAGTFQKGIRPAFPWIIGLQLLAALISAFLICGKAAFCLIGGVLGYSLALLRGTRSLGGMNGDIAGYSLTLSELCALAVLVFL